MRDGPAGRPWAARWGGALTLAVALAVAALAALRWRDVADAFSLLAGLSLAWVAAALAANAASSLVRALAWTVIVRHAVPAPRGWTVSAFLVGQLGNVLAPARLGEAAKVALLARRVPAPGAAASLAGSVVAHRLLDAAPLSLMALGLLVAAGLPGWWPALLVGLGVGCALLGGAALLAARERRVAPGAGRIARLVAELRRGLAALRSPAAAAWALVLQCLSWALEVAAVVAVFRAVGLDAGVGDAVLVVLATTVAGTLPLWPGNVGVYQVAVTAVLVPAGIPASQAIACGIALQAAEMAAAAGPGLAALGAEGVGPRGLRGLAAAGRPAAEARRGAGSGLTP